MAEETSDGSLQVLISGAGIAGPVCAYWLLRAKIGARICVVERDPEMRTTGQSIDLRGTAIAIVKEMGLFETIKSKTTSEAGIEFTNSSGEPCGRVAAAEPGSKSQTFTSEIEIFRGELAEIFYQATKGDVDYIFGDSIESCSQTEDSVSVTFAKGGTRSFDLVIGADGISSRLRGMAFGISRREHTKPLNGWTSYFTIKQDHLNGSSFARLYNAPGGRTMLLRPDPRHWTRANIGQIYRKDTAVGEEFRRAQQAGPAELKKFVRAAYQDAGWITPTILDGMDGADDFYAQEIAQVRLPQLYRGRIVFIGDSGSCPSAMTGMGTSLAVMQAYVLAGELAKAPHDVNQALKAFDRVSQPLLDKIHQVPSSISRVMAPDSAFGIKIVQGIMSFITRTHIDKLLFKLLAGSMARDDHDLPAYEWPVKAAGMEQAAS